MKTVLLYRTSFHPGMRLTYKPFYDFAKQADWQVQTVEHMNAAVSRYWRDSKAPNPNIRMILDFWKPDGCLVECGGIPDEPWDSDFKGIPTVFLDRPQANLDPSAICVSDDTEAVASLAAKELLSLERRSYAFVSFYEPLPWSESRGRHFLALVQAHGKSCIPLRAPRPNTVDNNTSSFVKSLACIKRPCGIFTANDETAKSVVTACLELGLSIPEDVAIVSVDNDLEICENLPVSLTSIELDHVEAVRKATHLLNRLMTDGPKGVSSSTFGVKRIVRRASANGIRKYDRRVAAAIEYIRTHATESISLADTVRAMGCSERLATLRFREACGHTILDEIHLRRIEIAQDLLRTGLHSIAMIAEMCGYHSATDFGRVFKRYTGRTPKDSIPAFGN